MGGVRPSDELVVGDDGVARCFWAGSTPEYAAYHDEEWGHPVRGEQAVFERLSLEGFQSGLAWITILRKREGFRRAFADFAVDVVAAYGADDVERLMGDAGIVRNGAKINATIGNARATQALGVALDELVWSYAPVLHARPQSRAEMPTMTSESTAMSKDLKRRGFRFLGPTTCYAAMQAMGLVDDHLAGCHCAP